MNRASPALSSGSPVEVDRRAESSRSGQAVVGLLASPAARTLLAAAGLAVAYGATARLGAALAFPSAPLSAVWLPNAILLAALLLAPRRNWWIYLVVAVLPAHLLVQLHVLGLPPARVALSYVMNCATALIGALALSAYAPDLRRIDCMRTAVAFILLAGVLAPVSTSVLTSAAALALNLTTSFWVPAIARTLTNTFAILTLVPVMLHTADRLREGSLSVQPARAAEASVLAVSLATLGILAFVAPHSVTDLSSGLLYAPFAILLWAAVRFGVSGACSSVLMLGLLATWGLLSHEGPFVAHSPPEDTISLLLFMVLTAVTLLLLAAAL